MKLNICTSRSLFISEFFKFRDNKILILFFVLCFPLSFNSVLAIGIGATPSFLDLELKLGQPEEAKILVYNISQEAGIFQVFPDELNDWIKIEPDNFRLEAGENKEVKIKILAEKEGRKTTNLSVLAKSLDRSSFNVSSGLKIPLRLNIEDQREFLLASVLAVFNQNFLGTLIIILIIFLIGFFLAKYLKKRKSLKVIPPPENLPVETFQQTDQR